MSEPDVVIEFLEALRGVRKYRRWYQGRSLPIKHNEMMLLMFLHHNLQQDCPGIQPSELGEILQLTRPAVTSLVNSLEDKGYVERINDAEDRRVVFVRPTNKGIELVEDSKRTLAENISEILELLGEEDTHELMRITRKIRSILEDREMEQDGGNKPCGN